MYRDCTDSDECLDITKPPAVSIAPLPGGNRIKIKELKKKHTHITNNSNINIKTNNDIKTSTNNNISTKNNNNIKN